MPLSSTLSNNKKKESEIDKKKFENCTLKKCERGNAGHSQKQITVLIYNLFIIFIGTSQVLL